MIPSKPRFVGECRRVKLNEICSKGKSSLRQKDVFNDGPFAVYGASGIVGTMGEFQNETPYVAVVKDGAGVGRANACEAMTSVLGTMQALIPNSDVERDYLLHLVRSLNLGKGFSGSTIPHIYFKDYGKLEVPLPSVEAQKQIVAQFNAIEQQSARAEAQIVKLDQLVKSRFVEMFGAYEPNCSIDDACVVLSGFAFKSTRYVDDGIRIMRIANVQKGYIEDKTPCYYPEADQNAAANYALREDDLLVSLTGNVGRVGLMTKELLPAALNQRVACLRPKSSNKLNTRYLFALLNLDEFEKAAIEASSGSAQKNLSIKWLKSHRIAIPPIEIQSAFDAFCKQVDKPRFVDLGDKGGELLLEV